MIPYIVAENPDIPHREAFLLSRQMMKNRWSFCFDCLSLAGMFGSVYFRILRSLSFTYMQTTEAELCRTSKRAFESRFREFIIWMINNYMEDTGLEEYPVERYKLYNPKVRKWIPVKI